jgi:hypothetical protein
VARPAPPPEASLPEDDPGFSAERAWLHMQALTSIGPRATGTPGAERARAYIRDQLHDLGLKILSHETRILLESGAAIDVVSLIAIIPGESQDLFVLAAPYDTRFMTSIDFVGANGGASGPALLLELARVLSRKPLPYTTWLVFLDGESPLGRGSTEEATRAWIGSTELAQAWAADASLESIRLLVYFDQVADAELSIARDLRSHRSYREAFWESALRLGYEDAFPRRASYESPVAGHLPFVQRGLRRAVLIKDTAYGGDEPPGFYAQTEADTLAHCSPDSLAAVGQVSVEALERIAARLAKIDRFADAPLRGPTGPQVPPPSTERAPDAGTPGPAEEAQDSRTGAQEGAPPAGAEDPDAP